MLMLCFIVLTSTVALQPPGPSGCKKTFDIVQEFFNFVFTCTVALQPQGPSVAHM